MGATDFKHISAGKDVADAFINARREALHWHGHGGYSGTIAEKDGYVHVIPTARVTAHKVYDTVMTALYSEYSMEHNEMVRGKESAKAYRQLQTWFGPSTAELLVNTADDKWGPCVAVRMSKSESHQYVPRTPTGKRKKNYNVWLFFGMASC